MGKLKLLRMKNKREGKNREVRKKERERRGIELAYVKPVPAVSDCRRQCRTSEDRSEEIERVLETKTHF
jgi:hypothetical protein